MQPPPDPPSINIAAGVFSAMKCFVGSKPRWSQRTGSETNRACVGTTNAWKSAQAKKDDGLRLRTGGSALRVEARLTSGVTFVADQPAHQQLWARAVP